MNNRPVRRTLIICIVVLFSACSSEGGREGLHTGVPGPVEPYYAGRAAEAGGRLDEAEVLYRLASDTAGDDLIRLDAAERYLRLLIQRDACTEARRRAGEYLETFNRAGTILVLYAEACLELGKNRQALWAAHEAWDLNAGAGELLLLAEAGRRTGVPGWRDRITELVLRYPASEVHLKARDYLDGAVFRRLDGLTENLLHGKALAAGGSSEEALERLRGSFSTDILITPLLVRETGELFDTLDRADEGSRFFREQAEAAVGPADEEVKAAMVEQAAELMASEGRWDEVADYLSEQMEKGSRLTDRAARLMLIGVMRTSSAVAAAETAERLLPELSDPGVFSGLLDELMATLTREGMWNRLYSLATVLEGAGPRIEAARCAYLIGRAIEEGYLAAESREPAEFFRTVVRLDPLGYYGFLAHRRLGGEASVFETGGSKSPDLVPGPADALVLGFFNAGMIDEGLAEAYGRLPELSAAGAAAVAEVAAEGGYYLDALRIMLRWNAGLQVPPGRNTLEMLYPRRFYPEISAAAREHGLPENIFFGLVREESAFQYDIASHAGAVGLSQLMPSTAEYSAGLMSLPSFDIHDPADNTMIGAWYLARMRNSLPSYAHALAAYNAGPGRTAGWLRWFGALPADLFVEAIPVTETRRYVKRVLVSSVYYGYLYDALPPEDTVGLYF